MSFFALLLFCFPVSSFAQDTTPPVFAAPPPNITVECISDVPAMTNLAWTDNVDGTGFVSGTDAPIMVGNCGGSISRSWTYTDAAGNMSSVSQIITISDTQPPVIGTPPNNTSITCLADIPPMTTLNWTDNCDGMGTISGTDGPLTGGTCGGTVTRTWQHTDACGNIGVATQVFTLNDTIPPTASNPDTTYLMQGSPTPAPDVLVVTDEADNCTTPTVAFVSEFSDNAVPCETITHTYSVTDDCSNQILVTHILTYCHSLGLAEPLDFDLLIYPNPTEGHLIISDNKNELYLELFRLNGELVLEQVVPAGGAEVTLHETAGIYVMRLTNENGVSMHRKICKL